ncbi:hypothetical protein GI374_03620 [Paracoccus sp. S-4012]|nr:hypothetical protein [Paracoccus sp. S-4012]
MRNSKDNDLADRRSTASGARAALLEAFRATREAAERTGGPRHEERLAIAAARAERHAERDRIKLEARQLAQEQKRLDAEAAQLQTAANVAARAKAEARARSDNMVARVVKDEAARKAERDRRYASRKARQR